MEKIKEILENSDHAMTAAEVARKLRLGRGQTEGVATVLNKMARDRLILREKNRYRAFPADRYGVGSVVSTRTGADFCRFENGEEKRITHSRSFRAMHGDAVSVRFLGTECEIVRILSRANTRFVGVVQHDDMGWYVLPENKKWHEYFFLPRKERAGVHAGDMVVACITSYPSGDNTGLCSIEEKLGDAENDDTVILGVLRSYGVEEFFPENVWEEAKNLERRPGDEEGRLDLRSLKIVTVDGESAKDLDDAVSLERTETGDYLLGVHIADVSHFVTPDSAIDREAQKRATSVYTPGKVFPMLPFRLSNDLCSLNEHEDKLALSCFMVISRDGTISDSAIRPSVIRSSHRMTYDGVTELLENPDSPLKEKYEDVLPMLRDMEELTKILISRARQNGAIDFDLPEAEILLDENGFPVEVRREENGFSHRMIEQFMLAANRTVAEYLCKNGIPGIFRVHEPPEAKKREAFDAFIGLFGYHLPENAKPADYRALLGQVAGKPEELAVRRLMLRSMSKAKYRPECTGHFGLAFEYYLHFTSPIRRYPDLAVHRMLHWALNNNQKAIKKYASRLPQLSELSTAQEINAVACERDVDDIRKAQYLSRRIGLEAEATVSGVTAYGLYAEMDNTCEGMIPIGKIPGYYEYREELCALVGKDRRFTVGDRLRIRVENARISEGKVEFSLLS